MTIPKNITRDHILQAIEKISNEGVPENRNSTQFNILFENKFYPPKYTISLANYYANGTELPATEFSGGEESNKFLKELGFTIVDNPSEVISKSNDTSLKPSFWWVNQGKTHTQEKEGGFLWAPQKSKRGFPVPHHVSLLKAKPGDIVFCYSEKELKSVGIVEHTAIESPKPNEITSDAWQKAGYLLKLNYFDFSPSIKKEEIPEKLRIEEGGPFDRNGDLKQGYFFGLTESFSRQLFQLFQGRFPREVRLKMEEQRIENEIIRETDSDYLTYKGLVDHIDHYIKSKGFYYTKEEIINLFLSLKTKPFVILSGISGTGKSKIAQWFAESVGANEKNGQFTLIPIRPDWNDGSDLLGYVDIKGDFKEGPLTRVIKKAEQNSTLPYFILLDEMNLARVEHYFSDILSVMESRKWENGKIISSNLLSEETVGVNLKLPTNLYIIGTVNMDETTHPFSKKVLDRANTIEFNRVALDNLAFLEELQQVDPIPISHEKLSSNYLHLKDVYSQHKDLVEAATNELVKMNEALQLINAHVGYRVRDEICFYLANNEEGGLLDYKAAMDHCILQKVLPRIAGSDSRVDELLRALYRIFTNKEALDDIENNQADIETAKYPRSAEKVLEMVRRLRDDGFTSFWVS